MIATRKFVTLAGEVLEESEWNITPLHKCFYCDQYLMQVAHEPCSVGFMGNHDFVTICNRE